MTNNYGSFTCARCGEDFDKALPQDEVEEEYRNNFPQQPLAGAIEICRECFQRYLEIMATWQPAFIMLSHRKIEEVRKRKS